MMTGSSRVHLNDAGEKIDARFAGESEVEEEEVVLVAGEGCPGRWGRLR